MSLFIFIVAKNVDVTLAGRPKNYTNAERAIANFKRTVILFKTRQNSYQSHTIFLQNHQGKQLLK